MILFILGLLIGSIGGMIMMAMFLTGKSRESSFQGSIKLQESTPSDTSRTDSFHNFPE